MESRKRNKEILYWKRKKTWRNCVNISICVYHVLFSSIYILLFTHDRKTKYEYISLHHYICITPRLLQVAAFIYYIYHIISYIGRTYNKKNKKKKKECRLYKRYKARNLDRVLSCVHHVVARIFPSLQRLFILYYYVYPQFSLYSIFTLLYIIIVFSFCGALLWNKSGEKKTCPPIIIIWSA